MRFPNLLILFAVVILQSCGSNSKTCTTTISQQREIVEYFTAEDLRAEPQVGVARALKHPGKIFWMGQYIFLTDTDGIHVIDNRQPAAFKTVAFIEIKGNWDVAARGNHLYADSYADLLVFDISKPLQPQLVNRLNNAWNWDNIISRYIEEDREEEMVKDRRYESYEVMVPCDEDVDFAVTEGAADGQAGSMARFNISGNYLYAVDNTELQVFNLSIPEKPQLSDKQLVDNNIETIFSYGNRLFIGGMAGMYIYDKTDPTKPVFLDQFKHVESCDPVVVDKDIAYVTLREDNNCQNAENKLIVLDVKDFSKATLLKEFSMQHPHGLGIKDNKLYLCEGEFGLKVFDVTDYKNIDQKLLFKDTTIAAFDLIPHAYYDLLLLTGEHGLYQYDIKNPAQPKRISALKTFSH